MLGNRSCCCLVAEVAGEDEGDRSGIMGVRGHVVSGVVGDGVSRDGSVGDACGSEQAGSVWE